jgi:hypothetical protein
MIRHDEEAVAGEVRGTLQRLDCYQQRHPALGMPIAVLRKFVEDQSTILASAIAFWAFFSVFSVAARLRHSSRLLPAAQPPASRVTCWAGSLALSRC